MGLPRRSREVLGGPRRSQEVLGRFIGSTYLQESALEKGMDYIRNQIKIESNQIQNRNQIKIESKSKSTSKSKSRKSCRDPVTNLGNPIEILGTVEILGLP